MVWTKLGKLVFGASDVDLCETLGVQGSECSKVVFQQSGANIEVVSGIMRNEALDVLKKYFANHNKG